jgi:C4-dicarboxylate transporter DctM subunit
VPVAAGIDFRYVHPGIAFLAAMELGYLTSSVRLKLFISSFKLEGDTHDEYWSTLPFLLVLLICAVLIDFLPQCSLFLLS